MSSYSPTADGRVGARSMISTQDGTAKSTVYLILGSEISDGIIVWETETVGLLCHVHRYVEVSDLFAAGLG